MHQPVMRGLATAAAAMTLTGLLAAPALATDPSEDAFRCRETGRHTFVYDPGRCNFIARETLASAPLADFYREHGFDRNFLLWAPAGRIDPGPSEEWTFCTVFHPAGSACPGPLDRTRVADTLAGPISVIAHGGAFISTVCGNFNRPGAGPVPRIAGVKYEDLNADGDRDAGEPGLAGWTIRLRQGGSVVASTTTAADGSYGFALDANALAIHPGSFTLEEALPAGWVQEQAPGPVEVPFGAGERTFGGNDFGNWRPATIGGRKFDDSGVDGSGAGDAGLGGWTIDLSSGATTVTAADGGYAFEGLRPGTYTVGERLQAGWRQTAPPAGAHTVTVLSGQVVDGADFGNVCLGHAQVGVLDESTGGGVPGAEVVIEEVEVPGILENDPALPRSGSGTTTFDGLLPGTYEVTVFLPDGVFTRDPDARVVDGRWAVVKRFEVRECDTTAVPVALFTESTPGKVTGGVRVPVDGGFATAGFEFMSKERGVRGSLEHQDHARGLNLHTRRIEAVFVEGGVAWIWGRTADSSRFLLRLVDAGEPGRQDRYELTVDDGYAAGHGSTIAGGNVQIHR